MVEGCMAKQQKQQCKEEHHRPTRRVQLPPIEQLEEKQVTEHYFENRHSDVSQRGTGQMFNPLQPLILQPDLRLHHRRKALLPYGKGSQHQHQQGSIKNE